jgi:hypothetical protein
LINTDVAGVADAGAPPPATSVASTRPQTAVPAVARPDKTWTRKRSSDDRFMSVTHDGGEMTAAKWRFGVFLANARDTAPRAVTAARATGNAA